MRSDRQREIREQLEAQKRASKKTKGLAFFRVLAVLYTILACAFVALLCWLNVLPGKYLYSGIGVLVTASIFIVPVMFSKNGIRDRKIGASIVAVALIGVFGFNPYGIEDASFLKEEFYQRLLPTLRLRFILKPDSRRGSGETGICDAA